MEREIRALLNNTFYTVKQNSQSISQIEKNVIRSSKQRRLPKDQLPSLTNLIEFKIISPFYDRNKICKAANC